MSGEAGFGRQQRREAWQALIANVMSRTGCPPSSVEAVLDDDGITPDTLDLLDAERWAEIARDAMVMLDVAGHRRDHCLAYGTAEDAAFVAAMRGLRLETKVAVAEQLIARVAFRSGEGANAALHAVYHLPIPREWISDKVMSHKVERLAMLAFAPSSVALH